MDRELYRLDQVAEILGLSRAKIYKLCAQGTLGPVIRIGRSSRIARKDLDVWIDEQRERASVATDGA